MRIYGEEEEQNMLGVSKKKKVTLAKSLNILNNMNEIKLSDSMNILNKMDKLNMKSFIKKKKTNKTPQILIIFSFYTFYCVKCIFF